jgi:hypothetical protein
MVTPNGPSAKALVEIRRRNVDAQKMFFTFVLSVDRAHSDWLVEIINTK